MNNQDIIFLFHKWNDALQTNNSENVANLYSSDAILLPTVSNKIRSNKNQIKDYFNQFLKQNPSGEINESYIRKYNELIFHSGIYTFKFKDNSLVQARFTFIYKKINNEWLIIEHHSSQMPEK